MAKKIGSQGVTEVKSSGVDIMVRQAAIVLKASAGYVAVSITNEKMLFGQRVKQNG
jgi:hypothetical protein